MLDTAITLSIPFLCASFALWGSVFYEKGGWREAVRFIVLLAASSQGDVFVDRYGNEYISTSAQSRIFSGNETWNTGKKYHIKGQSGTFYRKIK